MQINIKEGIIYRLYGRDLRRLCISKGWYTNGNRGQYERLLKFADDKPNVTTTDFITIAEDIIRHSANIISEKTLVDVCFEIIEVCQIFLVVKT